jgi:hypothetical protein
LFSLTGCLLNEVSSATQGWTQRWLWMTTCKLGGMKWSWRILAQVQNVWSVWGRSRQWMQSVRGQRLEPVISGVWSGLAVRVNCKNCYVVHERNLFALDVLCMRWVSCTYRPDGL